MKNKISEYSVLFIEDEKEVNDKITSRLQRYFEIVYSSLNAEDGYNIYKEKKPKILFVDINLPGMSGIELVEKIRKNDQETKVVMITAQTDLPTLLSAASLKLTKYIVKPIDRTQLEEVIELLLYELAKFQVTSKENIILKDTYIWNIEEKELFDSKNSMVHLSPMERKLLEILIKNRNITLSFDDLSNALWDNFDLDRTESLKVILKKLRKKLPSDIIKNEYGVGYKLII